MKKKFKLINIIPHILVAVTAIAIVIACGEGDIINVDKDAKIKREMVIAQGALDEKIDSINKARFGSSSGGELSSGAESGESSSSEEASSGSGELSSSSTELGESSSGGSDLSSSGTGTSSSSDEWELKCDMFNNPLVTKSIFGFELEEDIDKIPVITCVKVGAAPGEKGNPLEFDEVDWTPNIDWDMDGKIEGIYPNLKIEATRISPNDPQYVCLGKTANCKDGSGSSDFKICYRNSTNPICLNLSSSSEVEASSSSKEEVSSSSGEKVSSSSGKGSSSSSCIQTILKDGGIYQTPRITSNTPIGACFSLSCTGNLEAGYVGGSYKDINVPVCGSEDYRIVQSNDGNSNFNNPPASVIYTPICKTSGAVQVFLKTQLSSNTQYFNFKCSTPSSSSSSANDCTAPTITSCQLAKTDVTHGENIPPPTINCSCGALDLSTAVFSASSGAVPTGVDNWKNSGNAYYDANAASSNAISVSKVKCGGVEVAGSTSCGSITTKRPTCTAPPGNNPPGNNYMLGDSTNRNALVPAPTYSCGGSASNAKFSLTNVDGTRGGENSNWDKSPPEKNSCGYVGDRIARMYQVSCDGHPLSYGSYADTANSILCGIIHIKERPSCTFAKTEYTTTENVGPPDIGCSDGSEPSIATSTFSVTEPSGIFASTSLTAWTTGDSIKFTAVGSGIIRVSNIKCGLATLREEIPCNNHPALTTPPTLIKIEAAP